MLYLFLNSACSLFFSISLLIFIWAGFVSLLQINLKGLDGIQGPVYVGTGCCFNRQALYGYDPVLTEEDLEPNIIVKSCCGSRKKKGSKKSYIDKKRAIKRTESTIPIFNMEDIEEGVEGALFLQCGERKFLSHLFGWKVHQMLVPFGFIFN